MGPTRDRARGALLGLATGDALGTTLEFRAPGSFTPIQTIVGGGPFDLRPGEWTDDTSMALCLAESLIERRGFDAVDQLVRYSRWRDDGHLNSNGRCFDIGIQTSQALDAFRAGGSRSPLAVDPEQAGNGSIMRLAPVPIAYAHLDVKIAAHLSGESSRTTHPAARPVDACRYLGALIAAALSGTPKTELLAPDFWQWGELEPTIAEVAAGSFSRRDPPEISASGYVVRTLEAALWALARTDSFRDGALLAVNLGNDADTVGAVYGQIAGAIYGEAAIPEEWRSTLAHRQMIARFADDLYDLELQDSASD
jgi:ADP-ribosyl-[dinitrogen reductase] hydrolase